MYLMKVHIKKKEVILFTLKELVKKFTLILGFDKVIIIDLY